MVKGLKVGEVYRDQKILDVVVWGVARVRNDVSLLRSLPIETPLGPHVLLGDMAEGTIVPAPNEVKREGASRRIDIIGPGSTVRPREGFGKSRLWSRCRYVGGGPNLEERVYPAVEITQHHVGIG